MCDNASIVKHLTPAPATAPESLSVKQNLGARLRERVLIASAALSLAASLVILAWLPVLAYGWKNLPFIGAFVEPTLVFNDIGPQAGTPWNGIDAGLLVGGAYSALVRVVSAIGGPDLGSANPFLLGVLILILVVMLQPLRQTLQVRIESLLLFGTRDYREHLQQLTHDLTASVDVGQVFQAIHDHVTQVMQPASIHIFARDNAGGSFVPWGELEGGSTSITFNADGDLARALGGRRRALYLPPDSPLPENLASEQTRLARVGANVLVPISGQGTLFGWLALGPRGSGRPYCRHDLDFLEALRDQATLAIDRALLFAQVLRSESRFRAVVDTSVVKQRGLARQRGEDIPSRYDLKIVAKDGRELWMDAALGVFEYEGRPAVVGAAIDVTERKQAEKALQLYADRLAALHEIDQAIRAAQSPKSISPRPQRATCGSWCPAGAPASWFSTLGTRKP